MPGGARASIKALLSERRASATSITSKKAKKTRLLRQRWHAINLGAAISRANRLGTTSLVPVKTVALTSNVPKREKGIMTAPAARRACRVVIRPAHCFNGAKAVGEGRRLRAARHCSPARADRAASTAQCAAVIARAPVRRCAHHRSTFNSADGKHRQPVTITVSIFPAHARQLVVPIGHRRCGYVQPISALPKRLALHKRGSWAVPAGAKSGPIMVTTAPARPMPPTTSGPISPTSS